MKSIAFALMLVTVVVAQEPQDAIVPVDCRPDSDCQRYDDGARCIEGMCDCSGDDRSRYCTALALVDKATEIIKLTLSFVFKLISCQDLSDAIRTLIHTTVLQKVAYAVTGYDIVCGSVIVVFNVDAEVAKVDEVLQATTEQMQTVQQEVPVLQAAEMSTDFVYGNDTKQCAVDNAVSTIFLEDKICFPTCETGYSRVFMNTTGSVNGTESYVCSAGDSDDDLSATAIAAIVVAVVLFCGIIVAVIYYVTGKPNDEVPTQNEPYNEEKPTEEVEGQQQPQDITV